MRFSFPAPALLCVTAVALTGCGSSNLLDGSSAEDLQASLSQIQGAVSDGRCEQATSAVQEGLQRVSALPSSVDRDLVARIREGFQELEAKIPEDCSAPPETTTEEAPTTTDEVPTTTEETPTTTTEEAPPTTETTPSTTETTPTTPPETTPETDDDPSTDEDSGGIAPGDVDGPAATPRALRELEQAGRKARKRIERAMRDAGRAMRGDS